MIDLSALNAVELNAEKTAVSVGAGATWDAMYAKPDPLGLSVNGGRAVGVGKLDTPCTQDLVWASAISSKVNVIKKCVKLNSRRRL